MTNSEWVCRRSRVVAGLLALAAASVGCGNNEGVTNVVPLVPSRTVVGAAELTFINLRQTNATARLVVASSLTKLEQLDAANDTLGDVTTVTVTLVGVSDFSLATGDSSSRYVAATFAVRNAGSGTPLFDQASDNLTFVAVSTPNTQAGTDVSAVLQADGTRETAAFAPQVVPTDVMVLTGDGTLATLMPAVHVALSDSVNSATALPSDASRLLPFGFLVRGRTDFNGMPVTTVPFDGLVSFAFRLPNAAVEANDASTLSLLFLLVDDSNAHATP